MKILMISRLFYPHIGGVEKHVAEVGERLVKKGHEITVVTEKLKTQNSPASPWRGRGRANVKTTTQTSKLNGIEILRIPYPKIKILGLLYIWLWFIKNRTLINQNDIIHCHDVFIWYLPMRFLYPKKLVYTTFHGYEGSELPSRKAIFLHQLAEKLSRGNICIGDFHKKWYKVKPTFVSYGAVDENQIVSEARNEKTAIFIGRLSKDAGIMIYLKTLTSLQKQGINLSLDIFGDGPQRKEATSFAKKHNLACRFHGFVKSADQELPKFRDAFVSRYLAILEAMRAKKLVFAVFDNEIKRDYLEMAPFANWVVIESNPQKLAERVKYYLEHPKEEKRLVNNAYHWTRKQTWDKLTNLYLKLWEKQ